MYGDIGEVDRLAEPVSELGQLGDVRRPVVVVGDVGVLPLPADGAIVLLAQDVSVTRVTGEIVDDEHDDPLQGDALPSWLPPRHLPRRVERELLDRAVRKSPDTTVAVDQSVFGL